MRKSLILLLLLLVQACAQAPPRETIAAQAREIDRIAAAAMAQREIPGLAVVVLHRDAVLVDQLALRDILRRAVAG